MGDATVTGADGMRRSGPRLLAGMGMLLASVATMVLTTAPGTASAAARPPGQAFAGAGAALAGSTSARQAVAPTVAVRATKNPAALHTHDYGPLCSYNGRPPGNVIAGIVPGSVVTVSCTGWYANEPVYAAEASPLVFTSSGTSDDVDLADQQVLNTSPSGTLTGSFTVPTFTAPDPAAVCPPGADQIAAGLYRCGLILTDGNSVAGGYQGNDLVAFQYAYGAVPPPPSTVVGMASTPNGGGYWVVWSSGVIVPLGNAGNFGDASGLNLSAPIAHIVATPDGGGYWLVAGDGGTFAYGDAGFYGSMGGRTLNRPIVDLAPTVDGKGYWLVASDGGIFAFGDAGFFGSMGGQVLNKPVVGIAADTATGGYWEVATDGGIFAFGAPFYGSTGAIHLNQPINGMTASADNGGYLFVASDGGVFAFGDAGFSGSMGGQVLSGKIVGMSLDPATGGYWLVGADGGIFSFNCPFYGAG